MIGPVREREHFMDKLAIAEYKASDMGDKSITKVERGHSPTRTHGPEIPRLGHPPLHAAMGK